MPRAELRDAVALAFAGDWQRAHELVQRYEDDRTACWVHAVVHRIEGDLSNAAYWYRRAGRTMPQGVTTREELESIRATLD
jgi:hypothetical protein